MISDCLIIYVFFFYTLQCEFIIKANFVWNKAISLLFYICNVILRKAVLALTPEYYMLNWKAAKTNFIVFVWPDRGLTTIYHTQGEHASLTWQGLDYDLPHSRWTCQLDYDLPHSRWTCQLDLTGAWLRSTTLEVNMPAWPDRGLTKKGIYSQPCISRALNGIWKCGHYIQVKIICNIHQLEKWSCSV
jgi:hypothetical protein